MARVVRTHRNPLYLIVKTSQKVPFSLNLNFGSIPIILKVIDETSDRHVNTQMHTHAHAHAHALPNLPLPLCISWVKIFISVFLPHYGHTRILYQFCSDNTKIILLGSTC